MRPTSISDVRTIAINVTDQDDAIGFYVDKLGFEKRLDAPISPTMRWIEVAPSGATTSIALNVPDGTGDIGSPHVVMSDLSARSKAIQAVTRASTSTPCSDSYSAAWSPGRRPHGR